MPQRLSMLDDTQGRYRIKSIIKRTENRERMQPLASHAGKGENDRLKWDGDREMWTRMGMLSV
jgi:hypothetical protein